MTAPTETVELPKLPDDLEAHIEPMSASDLRTFIEDYARAAVLSDRASRSPVVGAVGGEPTEQDKSWAFGVAMRVLGPDADDVSLVTGARIAIEARNSSGIGVSPTGSPEGGVKK